MQERMRKSSQKENRRERRNEEDPLKFVNEAISDGIVPVRLLCHRLIPSLEPKFEQDMRFRIVSNANRVAIENDNSRMLVRAPISDGIEPVKSFVYKWKKSVELNAKRKMNGSSHNNNKRG